MPRSAIDDREVKALKATFQSDMSTLFRLTFVKGPATDGDIRVASVILRKWLTDGLLGRLTRALGHEATFPVLDNSAAIILVESEPSITYYLTAGVRFSGVPVLGTYYSSLDEPSALAEKFTQPEHTLLRAHEVLNQRRLYHNGSWFTCAEIIKFVANKLGGAHLDFNRELALSEASEFMTFGGPLENMDHEPPGELYAMVEPDGREIITGCHVEVIAASASFVQIRFDGAAFVDIEKLLRPTLRSRLQRFFGVGPKIPFMMHGKTRG